MIEVIRAGLSTSFQDRGRFGYRNQGVPLSGAMDLYSALLANQILGNPSSTAIMEFALQGPKLLFHEAQSIVITGGEWKVELNGKPIKAYSPFKVPADSELDIKGSKQGIYGYLAISGGWKLKKVLNSFSFYSPVTLKARIEKGDRIDFNNSFQSIENKNVTINQNTTILESNIIEAQKGPEFNTLNEQDQQALFKTTLNPSKDSNRMAYPIEHHLKLTAKEITTGPVQPGTVQLTPSGKLIVLMRDAQTTGGYARVLQLTPMAINQLAQKKPGEEFYFKLVD